MPDRPGSEDWVQKRKTMDGENMAGLGSALDKVRADTTLTLPQTPLEYLGSWWRHDRGSLRT